MPLLPERLPWFIAGPLLGLLVVGLYAVANRPLGGSGAYVQAITFFRDRGQTEVWRLWYLAGMVLAGLAVALLRGVGFQPRLDYGQLGQVLPLGLLVPVLLVGGLLIGYGARWGGGCTSGHGICGVAILSPASFAATGVFMATAIVLTFALHLLTGGAL